MQARYWQHRRATSGMQSRHRLKQNHQQNDNASNNATAADHSRTSHHFV
jgi:hypothetical protein